jgi:phosphatidylglycerophosphate synthase
VRAAVDGAARRGMPAGAAYAALRSAQKSSKGVSLYTRFVNRKLGRLFAAGAASIGASPNQVTAVSGLLTAAAIALVATTRPTVLVGVGAALLLVLGFALDSADGQLARLQQVGSPAGEWLDHVVDAAKAVALHAAVLITVYRHDALGGAWLLVPLGYQLVAVVVFCAGTLRELLGRGAGLQKSSSGQSGWSSVLLLPADFGILALTFVTLGFALVFFALYTALFAANLVVGGLLLLKWMRELSALRRG